MLETCSFVGASGSTLPILKAAPSSTSTTSTSALFSRISPQPALMTVSLPPSPLSPSPGRGQSRQTPNRRVAGPSPTLLRTIQYPLHRATEQAMVRTPTRLLEPLKPRRDMPSIPGAENSGPITLRLVMGIVIQGDDPEQFAPRSRRSRMARRRGRSPVDGRKKK
jgi:hypothetical protein